MLYSSGKRPEHVLRLFLEGEYAWFPLLQSRCERNSIRTPLPEMLKGNLRFPSGENPSAGNKFIIGDKKPLQSPLTQRDCEAL